MHSECEQPVTWSKVIEVCIHRNCGDGCRLCRKRLVVRFWTIPPQLLICVFFFSSFFIAIKILDLELIRQSFGFITKSINDYKHSLPQCNWIETESTWHHSIIYYYQFSVIQLSFASVPLQCVLCPYSFFWNGIAVAFAI